MDNKYSVWHLRNALRRVAIVDCCNLVTGDPYVTSLCLPNFNLSNISHWFSEAYGVLVPTSTRMKAFNVQR